MTDSKILYVTDLDGTLMRSDITISDYTVRTINALVDRGMNFTYATARSIESARPIAGGQGLMFSLILIQMDTYNIFIDTKVKLLVAQSCPTL